MNEVGRKAIEKFIAEENDLHAPFVKIVRVQASQSKIWSEWTSEDFSCNIVYTYGEEEKYAYWGEGDVAKFLNWLVGEENATAGNH